MRLWSLHPQYLDSKGLLALWREGLLAKKVLEGKTQGYTRHPQLNRFRSHPKPLSAINYFLAIIYLESVGRHYRFDHTKFSLPIPPPEFIPVTQDQLEYELKHLKRKLIHREPHAYTKLKSIRSPNPHPLFHVMPGPIEVWERITPWSSQSVFP